MKMTTMQQPLRTRRDYGETASGSKKAYVELPDLVFGDHILVSFDDPGFKRPAPRYYTKEFEFRGMRGSDLIVLDVVANQTRMLDVNDGKTLSLSKVASSGGRDMLIATDEFEAALKESKFEKGKPADPTKNMSDADAKEWDKQKDEHEDEFKAAGLSLDDYSAELKTATPMTVRIPAGLKKGDVVEVAYKRKPSQEFEVIRASKDSLYLLDPARDKKFNLYLSGPDADTTVTEIAQVPSESEPMKAAKMSEDEKEAKFEKGKPADPTKNMDSADKKEWNEQKDEHKDEFKAASETRVAEDLPPDVERYHKEVVKGNPSYSDSQAWATAWSIYCRANPGSAHCHENEYLKAAGDCDYAFELEKESKFEKGKSMTPEQVSKVVGPEFKENVENPPPAVEKLKEKLEKSAEWKGWTEEMPVQVVTENKTHVFDNLAEAKKKFPTLDPKKNTKDFTWATHGEVKGKPAIRFEDWGTYKTLSTASAKGAEGATMIEPSVEAEDKTAAELTIDSLTGLLDRIGKFVDADFTLLYTNLENGEWDDVTARQSLKSVMASKASSADKALYKKLTDHPVDGLKAASVKTAASGLYGFTKEAERVCGSATSRLSKHAAKLAKDIYVKDGETPAFLEEHQKRSGSRAARMLRACMADIGPGQPEKTAGKREGGRYGFSGKTSRLALQACADLDHEAGVIACDLNGRMGSKHATITGFFNKHAKKAKCGWSEMLLDAYPSAPAPIVASAKVAPTVSEILMWDGSGSRVASSFLASDEDDEDEEAAVTTATPKC